ncbi:phospholipase D family protein, partial [Acinetobacter variabilis]
HHLRYESLKRQLDIHNQEVSVQNYLDLTNRSKAFDEWLYHKIGFDWVKAEVVKDPPEKIKAKAKKEGLLNFQLLKYLDKPEQSVDLISA